MDGQPRPPIPRRRLSSGGGRHAATSAGGKSYLVEQVLGLFPPSACYALSAISQRVLAYDKEPLEHRMLVLYEAAGLSGDIASYLIRSLLSEGHVRYVTVEKTKAGICPKLIEREGRPAVRALGRFVAGPKGEPVPNPLMRQIAVLDPEIRQFEARFGLSPLSRLRLGLTFSDAAKSLAQLNAGLLAGVVDRPDRACPSSKGARNEHRTHADRARPPDLINEALAMLPEHERAAARTASSLTGCV